MQPYSQASNQYLAQRVLGASPEQLVALLLEGGQRFLAQAIQATENRNIGRKAQCINRVSAIIDELVLRLNHEEGGETVENLLRVYDWWNHEIFDASATKDTQRMARVSRQMGELRQAWEQVSQPGAASVPTPTFRAGDLVG